MFPLEPFPALMAPSRSLSLGGEESGTDKMSQSLSHSLLSPLGNPSLRFHAKTQDLVGPGDTGQIVSSQPQAESR